MQLTDPFGLAAVAARLGGTAGLGSSVNVGAFLGNPSALLNSRQLPTSRDLTPSPSFGIDWTSQAAVHALANTSSTSMLLNQLDTPPAPPKLDFVEAWPGATAMDVAIESQVRRMYGNEPIIREIPLTPMHGERLRARREYIETDRRRMAMEALGYNVVNYTRADRERLDREAWQSSGKGIGSAVYYTLYMDARYLNDEEHHGTGTAGQEAMRGTQDWYMEKSLTLLQFTGVLGKAPAAAAPARTNAQLVQSIATRAENWGARKGLTGTAQHVGIKKHGYADRLLTRYQGVYGDRGLSTEASVISGAQVKYGTAGSVRLDVIEGSIASPTAVYDYKFGSAGLSSSRVNQIRGVSGYGPNVPIIKVVP